MFKPLKQFIKQYLNFPRKDRNGILFLLAILILIVIANIVIDNRKQKSRYDSSELIEAFEIWEREKLQKNNLKLKLFDFNPNTISAKELDSLNLSKFIKNNILNYRAANGKFVVPEDLLKIYGMNDSIFQAIENYIVIPGKISKESKDQDKQVIKQETKEFFDPNTADLNQLKYFGLNQFQANNILEYRKKGGIFHAKNDLLKIYGIDSAFFRKIENQLLLEMEQVETEIAENEPYIIDLNLADSLQLIKLAGIGPAFASRILKYRNLLGGYVSKNQLLEIYNLPKETYLQIEHNVHVETYSIDRIRINFAEYADLLRHPYFKKEDVTAILKHRNLNGPFKSIEQIGEIKQIDSTTFHRIIPYITVD